MERKIKADEIPSHAHRLYIKLYFERKGEKNNKTIQDAKKSWKSLSLSKKKHFYKTTSERNLLQYTHSISKTEAYLKDKFPNAYTKRLDKSQSIEDQDVSAVFISDSKIIENRSQSAERQDLMESDSNIEIIEDLNQTKAELHDTLEHPHLNTNSELGNETELKLLCETQSDHDNTQEGNFGSPYELTDFNESKFLDTLETQSNPNSNQDGTVVIPLDEPAPPTIKFGKDLYEVIKAPEDKSWKEITKKERSHYNIAVRRIKQEYIKNYTKYLESLSQQQLFDHYMKTMYLLKT